MSNNPRYDAETIDLFACELGLAPASSAFTPNMPALMALQDMKAKLNKLLDLWAAVEATSFIVDGSTADWARAYRDFEKEVRSQLAQRVVCPECRTTICNRALSGRCGYRP